MAEHWRPGDLVWVHDYQLLRVPALVRERIPEARIGFFLHIPFPNPEIFFTLSRRTWLVEGILGADLIGVHTRRHRGHLTAALRRLFGIEMGADETIEYAGRRVRLGIFPMGVDAAAIADRVSARDVSIQTLDIKSAGHRLFVAVDRLDYSKGIPRRLLALEQLFLVDGMAAAMHAALTMPGHERRTRMRGMRRQVLDNDVHRWVAKYLDAFGSDTT